MSLKTKPTSFEVFGAAVLELDPSIKMDVDHIEVTVYIDGKRTKVPATLVRIGRPGDHEYTSWTICALFDDEGRYLSGKVGYGKVPSVGTVVSNSYFKPSKPFGMCHPLKVLLTKLHDNTPAAIAARDELKAAREAQLKADLKDAAQAQYEAARDRVLDARMGARNVLGEAATKEVLDYFLPMPTPPAA